MVGFGKANEGLTVDMTVGPERERSPEGAQVVDRVFDILDTLVQIGPELGLSDISRALGLKKATTYRLLTSLRHRGIVAQDRDSKRYRLGLRLWELGSVATTDVDWILRASPVLRNLTAMVGETSHIAILNDGQVLYVDKVESARSLRIPSQVGRRLPVHCNAIGKVQIAFLPDEIVIRILERWGMETFTRNTVTSIPALRKQLALIRKRGYSIDNEEIEEGLMCIGAPIRDRSGSVVAGISISGPDSRLRPELFNRAKVVVQAANTISASLGCSPSLLQSAGEPAPAIVEKTFFSVS
jgi:DNA-binding IclR family transcriptional regulator